MLGRVHVMVWKPLSVRRRETISKGSGPSQKPGTKMMVGAIGILDEAVGGVCGA